MITVGKASGAGYYTGGGGGESESYYLDAVTDGEPPGRWSGRLAGSVGLSGEVDADDMEGLFERFETPDGTVLGRRPISITPVEDRIKAALEREPDALPERIEQIRIEAEAAHRQGVTGWDLTFSVPKSVTVAHTAAWRAELEAIRVGDLDRAAEFTSIRVAIEAAIDTANTT